MIINVSQIKDEKKDILLWENIEERIYLNMTAEISSFFLICGSNIQKRIYNDKICIRLKRNNSALFFESL